MPKIDDVKVTVSLADILELIRLTSKIEMPDVTYCEELLPMAQQAIRLSQRYASEASNILYKWTHDKGYYEELVNATE